MVQTEQVDLTNQAQVKRFIRIPYRLYEDCKNWVPPLLVDVKLQVNKKKHPFYEHSDADFFIAVQDGRDVGRIAALENRSFNQYHQTRQAQFYMFECENNQEAANALFDCVFTWAKARNLDTVVGPKGFSVFDGYGIQIEGFEHRQMMTMMNYNYEYYRQLVENLGFTKEVDFVSCYMSAKDFNLPDRVRRIAERVVERGKFKVHNFQTKKELKAYAQRIGKAYNNTFVNNWEYYPLTENEVDFILQNILTVADPKLIKIITHQDDVVGFLFGFPDVSTGLQRAKGHLFPFGIFHILSDMKKTQWISLNGAGILPEYQGFGGNALLYTEISKTIHDYQFKHADLTQVAETAVQMRSDLVNVGGRMYKNHRVYRIKIM